jgi:glycosyltransferase involved in cell wall biosynthesis
MKYIAFISTFGQRCGIATYTEALASAVSKLGYSVDILAEKVEKRPGFTSKLPIHRVWDRARFGRMIQNTFERLTTWPDIVHIQHEFGLFPHDAQFFELVAFLKQHTKVYITLHTVTQPVMKQGFWRELAKTDHNVIVHTAGALAVVGTNGHLIPHGCEVVESIVDYSIDKPALCPGFVSKSKGHVEILEAVARSSWSGGLRILGECRDDVYAKTLEDTIAKFDIKATVENRFVDDLAPEILKASFVVLGNYLGSPYSASGQMHTAMGLGIPIIAKRVPIYEGIPGVLYYEDDIELAQWFSLMNNANIRKALGHEVKGAAQSRKWNTIAHQHVMLYNQ